MRISPPWMFALALTVTGGAVSGASIGTAPVLKRGLEPPAYHAADTAPAMAHRAAPTALPDHYALETPNGRVEVGELALRGRMHDTPAARYLIEEREAISSAEPFRRSSLTERERAYYGYEAAAHDYPAVRSRSDLAYETAAPARPRAKPEQISSLSRAEAPLTLAEPAPVAPGSVNIGKARMIDVSASLASRE